MTMTRFISISRISNSVFRALMTFLRSAKIYHHIKLNNIEIGQYFAWSESKALESIERIFHMFRQSFDLFLSRRLCTNLARNILGLESVYESGRSLVNFIIFFFRCRKQKCFLFLRNNSWISKICYLIEITS
jgi:hypothetical protein